MPAHRPRKDRARVFFLESGFAFGTATLRAMARRVELPAQGAQTKGGGADCPDSSIDFSIWLLSLVAFCTFLYCTREDEGEGFGARRVG